MALQLRIISDHRRLLGERASLLLDGRGVTIGRAADNDWVLPDRMRYVSAHHARIHHRDGLYILDDISTNGVFLNGEDRPLAERGAHVLRNGDVLRLGEYQVLVVQEADLDTGAVTRLGVAATPEGSIRVHTLPSQVDVVQGVEPGAPADLDASLSLSDLLRVDPAESARLARLRVNAFGHPIHSVRESVRESMRKTAPPQAASADEIPVLEAADPGPGTGTSDNHAGTLSPTPVRLSALIADAGDSATERKALAHRIARLARAAELAQERHAQAQPQAGDLASGLAAFCKGAGIDPAVLPGDAQSSLLQLAGLLFRESLLGMKDLERVRRDSAARMGIRLPEATATDEPGPSLVQLSVEEVLTQVLAQHQTRRLDAVQWLRRVLETARAHDRAVLDAVHVAFTQFIARLDPVELEARFQRGLHNPQGAEARYWTLFGGFYRSLTEMPSGHLPHVFLETFDAAYKELTAPRDGQ